MNVTLDLTSHTEVAESFNVIAETKQGRDDNVVMLGAHLDGVEEGPGINDNGTGSATILEVAVQLAKSHTPHHNTVRFAWWGAEELGLIGSTAYVEELATQEGELDRIATYLNYDMVGSPNYIIGVYDADESTYPAPVDVPEGSEATEDVLTSWFDSIGQPWVDTEFSGRSDYQAFILNGVPASGLFTGADDVKTAEEVALFGGTAGITHDPNYHSVGRQPVERERDRPRHHDEGDRCVDVQPRVGHVGHQRGLRPRQGQAAPGPRPRARQAPRHPRTASWWSAPPDDRGGAHGLRARHPAVSPRRSTQTGERAVDAASMSVQGQVPETLAPRRACGSTRREAHHRAPRSRPRTGIVMGGRKIGRVDDRRRRSADGPAMCSGGRSATRSRPRRTVGRRA